MDQLACENQAVSQTNFHATNTRADSPYGSCEGHFLDPQGWLEAVHPLHGRGTKRKRTGGKNIQSGDIRFDKII